MNFNQKQRNTHETFDSAALQTDLADSVQPPPGSKLNTNQSSDWTNWKWQQRLAIKSVDDLCDEISGLPASAIRANAANRKVQITPYYLKLIKDQQNNDIRNRLVNQVVPYWEEEIEDGYNGHTENWELSHEMKTPICQHKYDNRVILRIANVCNAYCQFCFEALRTINTEASKPSFNRQHWEATRIYVAEAPEIEEVIFSGGEPLMLDDAKLRQCLLDIRSIRDDLLIRVHSRSLTFNPYRITDELVQSLSDAKVNAFGVHVCHPAEITEEFLDAVRKIRSAVPIVFANMPVLKNINDDYETLSALFLTLYRHGIVPYYLYHFMPFSPGSSEYRASVSDIVAIMRRIKRHKSNIAVPEYVLPHARGKFTVPLLENAEEYPRFQKRPDGTSVYSFTNWLGERHEWRDA
jgi:lysine 2,3-aminomutase